MELVVAFDLVLLDGGDDFVLEGVHAHCGCHEIHAVEYPAAAAQQFDGMAVQDRSGRVADQVQAHFGFVGEVRGFFAGFE